MESITHESERNDGKYTFIGIAAKIYNQNHSKEGQKVRIGGGSW